MKRSRWRLMLLASVLAGACGAAAAMEPPSVAIASIDHVSMRGQRARLDVTLSVHNSNGLDVPLHALRFRCSFDGAQVAQGVDDKPVSLPAGGDALVPVTLDVDAGTLLGVLAALPPDGQVVYEIQGEAEIGLTMLRVPFDHRGSVRLRVR